MDTLQNFEHSHSKKKQSGRGGKENEDAKAIHNMIFFNLNILFFD